VIRAGTTTEEIIGSSIQPRDRIDDFASMTGYAAVEEGDYLPADFDNITFKNPLKASTGSRKYYEFSNVPIDQPPSPLVGNPYPNILGRNEPPADANDKHDEHADATFDFSISSGDTVIVRARKQPEVEFPGFPLGAQIELEAKLAVTGVPVTVNGYIPTSPESYGDGAGFSFSYTVP